MGTAEKHDIEWDDWMDVLLVKIARKNRGAVDELVVS